MSVMNHENSEPIATVARESPLGAFSRFLPLAVRPKPANSRRVPRSAPCDRPHARSARHTAPHVPLPVLHPHTPGPLRSPSRTAPRGLNPATAATADLDPRLSFDPRSWHSCSWQPPSLTQPDLPIGRGTPPVKSQQPSGHAPSFRE